MALLDDILTWTISDLTSWQRDAARRLFQKESELTVQDFDEVYRLMKAAHGLPNPDNLQPIPFAAEHLPARNTGAATVVLKAMRDLRHVNRIALGQTLSFSPNGITVIYGGNGTGKSGYSRVLKLACRARDQAEPLHPDATDPAAQNNIPEATFELNIGGTDKIVKWIRGSVPADELSTIAVFDGHCARAYLSEGEAAYRPYGLDVVENLAQKVIPELNTRLAQELAGVSVDVEPFTHLLGDTVVGKMVATLNAKTDPALVNKLATLTQIKTDRLNDLNKALAEADPKAKAKQIRLSAQRLEGLAGRMDAALTWVSDAAITKLKNLDDAAQAAMHAEKVAAEKFRADEALLPGTGEPIWKLLFQTARKFSVEVAYPDHQFPHVGDQAQCPLCQQVLDSHALDRMRRFEQYVKEDAATIAEERRKQIADSIQKIDAVNLHVGLDDALSDELTTIDEMLCKAVLAFEAHILGRRSWMLDAIRSHAWSGIAVIEDDPRQNLRDLAAKLTASANELEKAADESKRQFLTTERDELRARQTLGLSAKAITAVIDRMKQKSALDSCKQGLKTKAISDKSKEFANNAVTAALKTALNDEFKALGIGYIQTRLSERNDKGKTKYRLLLDFPGSNRLEEILSEGEQRAIAIGSFLAELRLANHLGAIVFDDPVSSLDHWRRRDVARRLVEEAKQRQVVVLTHDTAFLGELRDAIELFSVACTMNHLEWRDNRPGHVNDGLPWDHMGYKQRIKYLEDRQKALEKPWPSYPNENQTSEIRRLYSLMRATVERVVEDVILNGIVQRYDDRVHVGNLHKVLDFKETECKKLTELYGRCHRVVDAHDQPSLKNAIVPTANEFDNDLRSLNAVIAEIQNNRKQSKAP